MKSIVVKILNKFFKTFHMTRYYETEYGIKVLNRPLGETSQIAQKEKLLEVSPSDLYLGIDGLKDKYTLTGCCCNCAPHFELMECCNKRQVTNCNYVKREKKGYLDGRDAYHVGNEMLQMHLTLFQKRKDEIGRGDYKPVTFYTVEGIKYIANGKHRAALCDFLGRKVICCEISCSSIERSYMTSLLKLMRKKPNEYQKNIALLEALLKE